MERKVLLAFRGIVDSLFKGKDVFVMGGYLLEKEHLMFLERVHRVYPHLTRDDTLIMLLVRMRFRFVSAKCSRMRASAIPANLLTSASCRV
jgi:hypothetical protein